jgi:hypothetical protein
LLSPTHTAGPVGLVAVLMVALQPLAAREQAVVVDTPASSGQITNRSNETFRQPSRLEPSASPRWEFVEDEAASVWASPTANTPSGNGGAGSASGPRWELVEPAATASHEQTGPNQPLIAVGPIWEPIPPGEEITEQRIADSVAEAERKESESLQAETTFRTQQKLPVFGLGVGARAFSQDETLPAIQGSIRIIQTGNDVLNSISIRPTVILPYDSACPSSGSGPGCEFEYRLAATFDFFQTNYISGFIGAGAAFNKDSLDVNAAMATIGIEANLSKNITVSGTLNLIDSDDPKEFGGLSWADAELIFTINARF